MSEGWAILIYFWKQARGEPWASVRREREREREKDRLTSRQK